MSEKANAAATGAAGIGLSGLMWGLDHIGLGDAQAVCRGSHNHQRPVDYGVADLVVSYRI